jgi:hypothetical protein
MNHGRTDAFDMCADPYKRNKTNIFCVQWVSPLNKAGLRLSEEHGPNGSFSFERVRTDRKIGCACSSSAIQVDRPVQHKLSIHQF